MASATNSDGFVFPANEARKLTNAKRAEVPDVSNHLRVVYETIKTQAEHGHDFALYSPGRITQGERKAIVNHLAKVGYRVGHGSSDSIHISWECH